MGETMKSQDDTLNIDSIRPGPTKSTPENIHSSDHLDIKEITPSKSVNIHQPIEDTVIKENNPLLANRARYIIAKTHNPLDQNSLKTKAHPLIPALRKNNKNLKTEAIKKHVKKVAVKVKHRIGFAKPIIGFIGILFIVFVISQSPIIFNQIRFLFNKPSTNQVNNFADEKIGPQSIISIPKINVTAPIVYASSNDEVSIDNALKNGVVHYAGTALPGELGNSVVVGHSSNDWWQPGDYKFVFILLDKLIPGDTFSVNYQSKRYVYKVTEVKTVLPTDLSVLAPTSDATFTLITCTPAGTDWKRLVVKATQIAGPNPRTTSTEQTSATSPSANSALPGDNASIAGFFQSIGNFFKKLVGLD